MSSSERMKVEPREWDLSPDPDFGPHTDNGVEVIGWHRRYEGQDADELLAGFEECEAAYGWEGRRSLQLKPVHMREASEVECRINGWEEGTMVDCKRPSRAKSPEAYWQIEVVPQEVNPNGGE